MKDWNADITSVDFCDLLFFADLRQHHYLTHILNKDEILTAQGFSAFNGCGSSMSTPIPKAHCLWPYISPPKKNYHYLRRQIHTTSRLVRTLVNFFVERSQKQRKFNPTSLQDVYANIITWHLYHVKVGVEVFCFWCYSNIMSVQVAKVQFRSTCPSRVRVQKVDETLILFGRRTCVYVTIMPLFC